LDDVEFVDHPQTDGCRWKKYGIAVRECGGRSRATSVATAEVIMTNVSAISMEGIETLPMWQPKEIPAEYTAQFGETSKCAVELMQRFDFEGFLKRVHPDGIAHAIAKDRSFEECVREFVRIVRKLNFLAQLDIGAARALWETYVPVRFP
jgi:hypothetical protein